MLFLRPSMFLHQLFKRLLTQQISL